MTHDSNTQTEFHRSLTPAGRWFLNSGVQETGGGIARYYLAEQHVNRPVSNEITGYGVSALLYLHARTGEEAYRTAALQAADFLRDRGWDAANSTFPFEPSSPHAYFFDIGIIGRGLLAAWRASGNESYKERAQQAALSLAFDFMNGDPASGPYHPVIELPEKLPLPREPRWSREPGCYQLKSALLWHELGEPAAQTAFEHMLAYAIATHEKFLPGAEDRAKVMDRLHAYSYFLEALVFAAGHVEARQALAAGLDKAAQLYRDIAPEVERSDVAAQILRVRLIAHHLDLIPLDEDAADEEASRAAAHQALDAHAMADPRLYGGFWFGSKANENGSRQMLPYSNPVSTAFCLQALDLWQQHRSGHWTFQLASLI